MAEKEPPKDTEKSENIQDGLETSSKTKAEEIPMPLQSLPNMAEKSAATLKSFKVVTDVNDVPLSTDFVLREFFGPASPLPPNVERRITTISELEKETLLQTQSTQLVLVTDGGEEILLGGPEHRGCFGFCIRIRGILLALLSAISFSLSTYLCHWLMTERDYSAPLILTIRFTFMSIVGSSLALIYEKCGKLGTLEPLGFSEPAKRRTMWMIFIRSGASCLAVIFQMYSLLFITPADSSVIIYSNPVFVAFFARIFLNEACGIFQTFAAMITIVGVVIIAKPPFIAGGASYNLKHLIGISLALSSMLSGTVSIILVRVLRYVHWTVLNSIYPFFGLIAGLCLIGASTGFKLSHNVTVLDAFIFLSMSFISFVGLWSSVLALKYEEAGTVTIVRSSEVIFSFLWQMISNIYPDLFSLIGAFLVMLCITLTGFRKVVATLDQDSKIRKYFWFVLK